MEEKINSVNVQFASLTSTDGFRIYPENEVAALLTDEIQA